MKITDELNYRSLNVLKQRLVVDNRETLDKIDLKLSSIKAGISGETRLVEFFNKYSFLEPYEVLMNINLRSSGMFQIDCLVITQYFALILESKNISGHLRFEENPERLVRERSDGVIDVFESPEIQVERNCMLLQQWFYERNIDVSIIGAIVFTSVQPPFIIKEPSRVPSLLVKTIPVYLNRLWRSHIGKPKKLNVDMLAKLSTLIQRESKQNLYLPFPLCERWNIKVNQLKRGVRCLVCGQFGMEKINSGWKCIRCGVSEKHAHIRTIQEWFMLVKTTMTNRECRDFLLVEDRHVVKRLMKSCDLEEIGSTKGTIYKWKWH